MFSESLFVETTNSSVLFGQYQMARSDVSSEILFLFAHTMLSGAGAAVNE